MIKIKTVICASAKFGKEILEWKEKLENQGFKIIKYPELIKEDIVNNYKKEFADHYDAITKADAIFVLNLNKKGIDGYIGPGVFAEMAFALGLTKPFNKKIQVYHLNPLPEADLSYNEELKLWQELGWIKLFKPLKI